MGAVEQSAAAELLQHGRGQLGDHDVAPARDGDRGQPGHRACAGRLVRAGRERSRHVPSLRPREGDDANEWEAWESHAEHPGRALRRPHRQPHPMTNITAACTKFLTDPCADRLSPHRLSSRRSSTAHTDIRLRIVTPAGPDFLRPHTRAMTKHTAREPGLVGAGNSAVVVDVPRYGPMLRAVSRISYRFLVPGWSA